MPLAIHSLHYREAVRRWRVDTHHHRVHQWYCCIHGALELTLEGQTLALGPEQSVLVRPNARRHLEAPDRAPGYLVALFENRSLDLETSCHRILTLPSNLRDDLLALVGEVRSGESVDGPHLRQALLVRLLIGAVRANRVHQTNAPSALNAALHRSVAEKTDAFMSSVCHRPVSRAEIAHAVALSEPHLARLFKAATGSSLMQRLTEHRMARARALLLETSRPITVIAGEVGFASFSHFALVFKRTVGVTPSDYRRSGGHAWSVRPGPPGARTRG